MTGTLAEAVRRRDARALARALTVVENDPVAAAALLADLGPSAGNAHRIGVTGPPGVGKSTLVSGMAAAWRAAGRRVGILAVDPSSPFSGGALLGDRIRMGALAGDPDVFIRSLASRGASGGLALAVDDAADVLDAADFDPVVLETVGVGQAEIEVARAADTTVLVLAPGGGDEIQAMKAGLLEAADLIVVNQADRRDADTFSRALEAAFHLRAGEAPPILKTVATRGDGVAELVAVLDGRLVGDRARTVAARRLDRARRRVKAAVERRLSEAFWPSRAPRLADLAGAVADGAIGVAEAASRLLEEETT